MMMFNMFNVKTFLQNVKIGYYLDFICEVNKIVDMILCKEPIEDIEDRAKYIHNKFFR